MTDPKADQIMLELALALVAIAVFFYGMVAWLYPDDAVPRSGANVFAEAFKKNPRYNAAVIASGAAASAGGVGGERKGGDSPLVSYLKSKCCAIPVFPDRDNTTFDILDSPTAFFLKLKAMILEAETKISISALYVGDGELSREFVKCLETRVEHKISEVRRALSADASASADGTNRVKPLQIEIVLDFNRMHHRSNLRTLRRLLELGAELHAEHRRLQVSKPDLVDSSDRYAAKMTSVRLHLFQTPSQLNRLYPPRVFGRAREILGVQHTKLFSFDCKHTIATGANLSDDYFITRMDRYVVVRDCVGLGVWYDEAIHTLTMLSYEVTAEMSDGGGNTNCQESAPIGSGSNSAAMTPKMTPKSIVGSSSPTTSVGSFDMDDFSLSGEATAPSFKSSPQQPRKSVHTTTQLVIRHCPMGLDATDDTAAFIEASKAVWSEFIDRVANHPRCGMAAGEEKGEPLTWIFPTVQFGRVGLYHDSVIVEEMVKGLASEEAKTFNSGVDSAAMGDSKTARFFFTSPYMNCYPELIRCMLQTTYNTSSNTKSFFNFITASINTNGWKGQRGFAGLIPSFYLQLLRNFHFLMKQIGISDRVKVFEYSEAGMTFHAKGLWICSASSAASDATKVDEATGSKSVTTHPHLTDMPFLAAYGSTNYGHRSVHKDVESEILIYTRDPALRAEMGAELERLLRHSSPVVEEELFIGAKAPGRFRPVVAAVAHMGHRFL